jgi:hypothetical protein
MEPRVQLQLRDPDRIYATGDVLDCACQIETDDDAEIKAVEASVLWFTEGKGDSDMSVHYFLRRVPTDAENNDLRNFHGFQTHLPNSPLSYAGVILKIRWCARVRVFLRRGREVSAEVPFQLGSVPSGTQVESPLSIPPRPREWVETTGRKKRERSAGQSDDD